MKIKKFSSTQKALLLTSASKLAISPSTASAGSKTGDGPPPNLTPQISLNQVVVPIDAFVPPMNDPNLRTGSVGADPSVNQFEGNMNAYGKAGIIFVGEIPDGGARMDFIVGNVRNDMPTDVYVVVSKVLAPDPEGDLFPGIEGWNTAPRSFHTGDREMLEQNLDGLILGFENAPPEEKEGLKFQAIKVERDLLRLGPSAEKSKLGWRPRPGRGNPAPLVLSGEICVDMENLEILGGVRVQPTEPLLVGSSSIGDARQLDFTYAVVSVLLSKEKLQQFDGQEVYFQAAALPANSPDPFSVAQVSECDRYFIVKAVEADPEIGEEGMDGSKEPPAEGTPTGDTPPSDSGGKGIS